MLINGEKSITQIYNEENLSLDMLSNWIKNELYKHFNIYKANDINIAINDYINYFNTERLAYSLGYKNPIQYRTEQGYS